MAVEAFPLQWPDGWPRTTRRGRPRYKVAYEAALWDLNKELRLMEARNVVVSSNVPVRRDGMPYADAARRRQDDPGVAVYFVRRGEQQVIACDKWDSVAANVRAVGLTVEALRGIERAGASELLDRAFTGFKALPAAGEATGGWWQVLGVARTATRDEVRDAYRALARKHHPDVGGDAGAMAMINRAYEQAQEAPHV
jgi:hypothetical protein